MAVLDLKDTLIIIIIIMIIMMIIINKYGKICFPYAIV